MELLIGTTNNKLACNVAADFLFSRPLAIGPTTTTSHHFDFLKFTTQKSLNLYLVNLPQD